MYDTALVEEIPHGYDLPAGYEILAEPLGGFSAEDRARRIWPDSNGPGVTTDSHALALAAKEGEKIGKGRPLYIIERNGSGVYVWKIRGFYDRGELESALLAMPERALYSLLYRIADGFDAHGRNAREQTAQEWRRATIDKRVRRRTFPARGKVAVWIEPARLEGETEESHKVRCIFAKPAGVR